MPGYADETLRELRARISWDRVNNLLRPLPGSSRLATTGGGTIADRGAFGVYLQDRTTRVGEVDKEFVYETRVGDTFILGTSVWRVTEMDQNRLVVSPAPGQPARMPFWRGEGIGRSTELGSRVSQFRGELARRLDDAACLGWLQREFPIDARSAWNILEYFRRQRDACGAIPDDHTVVVEGFSDEIGDARLIVHSALGRRVNLLLGISSNASPGSAQAPSPRCSPTDSGRIILAGTDITTFSEDELAPFRNRTIGYVFQSFHLVPSLTALENVMFPAELSREPLARSMAMDLLERVDLAGRRNNFPHQLSGGEKQRVAICRALINRPQILFADEPTGYLDSANGDIILRLLLELRRERGATLVLATHSREISSRADQVVRLADGRITPAPEGENP